MVLILLLILTILISWAAFSTREAKSCIHDGLDGECSLGIPSSILERSIPLLVNASVVRS
jgi:hypothetical protein